MARSTVFVEALPAVLAEAPDAKIRFIGGGSEFGRSNRSRRSSASDAVIPRRSSPALPRYCAALPRRWRAFVLVGQRVHIPQKLYASTPGAPAIFAGVGPAVEF